MQLKITVLFLLMICYGHSFAQKQNVYTNDTTIYSYDSASIGGKKYFALLNYFGFNLLNAKNEIIMQRRSDYFACYFKDFNNDGFKDLFLDKGGNTPERFDLLLYIPVTKSFRQVSDFENFPSPEKIKGTKYYYSYHKSGCADMDWDSDLFYIKNFKAVRVANISGRECGSRGVRDGLYVNRLSGSQKIFVKVLPIDTVHKFKGDKWEFIKRYWTKNYRLFL